MEIDPHVECDRAIAWRVQAADQDADRAALGENRRMLFWALLASGQITMRKVDSWQSLTEKPSDQIIDLAAWAGNIVMLGIALK
jgi:hypothetical protein